MQLCISTSMFDYYTVIYKWMFGKMKTINPINSIWTLSNLQFDDVNRLSTKNWILIRSSFILSYFSKLSTELETSLLKLNPIFFPKLQFSSIDLVSFCRHFDTDEFIKFFTIIIHNSEIEWMKKKNLNENNVKKTLIIFQHPFLQSCFEKLDKLDCCSLIHNWIKWPKIIVLMNQIWKYYFSICYLIWPHTSMILIENQKNILKSC